MIESKTYVNILFFTVAWLLWTPCTAQDKYEREFSIKSQAVPKRATDFVNSIFKAAKIHWYGEESLTGKSIEAKLKSSGKRYSIEFDEAGNIQDIEIMSGMGQMPAAGRAALKDTLSKSFSRYKVMKTQEQWSGPEDALKESIVKDKVAKGILVRYEFIVKGTRDKRENYFEVLSESDGGIVSIRQIVQRNTDNLIY